MFLAINLLAFSALAADAAKGKDLFQQRCASCHGAEGKGDGPIALGLPADMKPRNLAEGVFKVATDDAKLLELLKKGGSGMGLNALMPPQPDLKDEDLTNIITFVRSLHHK